MLKRLVVALASIPFAMIATARADAVSDFYTGKTISMVIGNGAGGTYDLYARAIARFLGRHIPGNPRVNIQNMPGAASYIGASHVFNVAPQDGTVIGSISAALPFQPLIDPNSPKLDVPRIQWVAFVVAAVFAGLAGSLYAFSKGSLSPDSLGVGKSVDGLVMVLLGGVQTLVGPVVGAVSFTWLQDTVARSTDYWRAMLGGIVLLLVLAFPQGIAGFVGQLADRLIDRRRSGA